YMVILLGWQRAVLLSGYSLINFTTCCPAFPYTLSQYAPGGSFDVSSVFEWFTSPSQMNLANRGYVCGAHSFHHSFIPSPSSLCSAG
ncbi:MAG: hypothetical protein J5I98_16645, partial [Phaeodactylibacter sp.]|nr:hypothetical protein [Phaeodactylibacter sp.]